MPGPVATQVLVTQLPEPFDAQHNPAAHSTLLTHAEPAGRLLAAEAALGVNVTIAGTRRVAPRVTAR